MLKKTHRALLVGAAISSMSGFAQAGMPLSVQVDQSQLLTLNADPGTVVVGNPAIADVSLNGRQVFIHGHAFGETNLMIFDNSGAKLGEFDITVGHNTPNQVTMFVGSEGNTVRRYTLSCSPECEPNIMVGDAWVNGMINDTLAKNGFTNGVKSSDVAGKPAQGGQAN